MNAIWEKNLHIYWYEICTIYIQYSTLMGTNIPKMVLKNPLHLYYCFEMPDCEVLIWFTYIWRKTKHFTVASAPTMRGSIFMRPFRQSTIKVFIDDSAADPAAAFPLWPAPILYGRRLSFMAGAYPLWQEPIL